MPQEIIQTNTVDQILEITFQMNAKNTVDAEFGPIFKSILDAAAADKAVRGLIIKGGNGFFSNGFDPDCFLESSRKDIENVIGPAFRLCADVMFHPLPSAIVMNGHAMGYGAILSLYGDYRYMQAKQARFGFPEVQIGLPVPAAPALLLKDLCGRQHARDLVFAKALKADQALEWGILDAVMEDEVAMMAQARKELLKLFKFPRSTIAMNRQMMNAHYKERILAAIESDIEKAAIAIMAPVGQAGLSALKAGKRVDFSNVD